LPFIFAFHARCLQAESAKNVTTYNPRWYGHQMRIKSPDELDDELLGWLCEAYKVGEQKP
jgi:hypothetical protein